MDRIARSFADAFGKDRVTVLPMEWLGAEPRRIAGVLTSLLGEGDADTVADALQVRMNARPRMVPALLLEQGRTTRLFAAIRAGWQSRRPSAALAARIDRFAAPGIERLASEWDLPLAELGYSRMSE